jgi:hypothetical protein
MVPSLSLGSGLGRFARGDGSAMIKLAKRVWYDKKVEERA